MLGKIGGKIAVFDLSEANPRETTCGSGYREVPETERWEKNRDSTGYARLLEIND